ncbi:MAG TPA: c-type cytochrome [Wenzhouxiangella sp.]|nr:c-type cytochrome [Wenzhouxiangella sp.]HLS05939.1 c-type cytochrome [Wenzhouxiangella sp.]
MFDESDQRFLKTFSWVQVGLIGFAVLILLLAWGIHRYEFNTEPSTARQSAVKDRLAPVAGVYSGDTGRAAAQAAAEKAAAASVDKVAFDGSTDGEMIYSQVCAACHDTGAAGAPVSEPGAWDEQLEKGYDTLLTHAIEGFNAMPARGGRADLNDEQVAAALDYIIDKVE